MVLTQDFKEFVQSLNDNHFHFEEELDDVVLPFIDLDNLKKNKKASGRLQDLADLENLQ